MCSANRLVFGISVRISRGCAQCQIDRGHERYIVGCSRWECRAPGAKVDEPSANRAPSAHPRVCVIVVNYNGAHHLPDCLSSLAKLTYPSEQTEVIVVDNGSTDGSRELVLQQYPWTNLLALGRNVGFAQAVNHAAIHSDADCIALLNNDMRVEPSWLTELVAAYDPAAGYPCVGGLILNWDGSRVDFVDATINFHAFGDQPSFGRQVGDVDVRDRRDLPFACGGSMLVGRGLFLEAGGYDHTFFAYYEDVDFGWRLWVLGKGVRLAARARAYHRHHGTSGGMHASQRTMLLERNALYMMLKNLDDSHLAPVLAASMMLLVERAVIDSESDSGSYEPGAPVESDVESVSRVSLARLHAVAHVLENLELIRARRREIQAARQRSDSAVFEHFGRPLRPVGNGAGDVRYLRAMSGALDLFHIPALFNARRAGRVLVAHVHESRDDAGCRTSHERAWNLARSLSSTADVTFASDSPPKGDEHVQIIAIRDLDISALEKSFDAVVLAGAAANHVSSFADSTLVIVDTVGGPQMSDQAIARADLVLCESEAKCAAWRSHLGAQTSNQGHALWISPTPDGVHALVRCLEKPWLYRSSDRSQSHESNQELLLRARTDLARAEHALTVAEQELQSLRARLRAIERTVGYRLVSRLRWLARRAKLSG